MNRRVILAGGGAVIVMSALVACSQDPYGTSLSTRPPSVRRTGPPPYIEDGARGPLVVHTEVVLEVERNGSLDGPAPRPELAPDVGYNATKRYVIGQLPLGMRWKDSALVGSFKSGLFVWLTADGQLDELAEIAGVLAITVAKNGRPAPA